MFVGINMGDFFAPVVTPLVITLATIVAATFVLAVLSKRGYRPPLWTAVISKPLRLLAFVGSIVLLVGALAVMTPVLESQRIESLRREVFDTDSNILYRASLAHVPLDAATEDTGGMGNKRLVQFEDGIIIGSQAKLISPLLLARPGQQFRYSFYIDVKGDTSGGTVQARMLWHNSAVSVTSWIDSPEWHILGDAFAKFQPEFHSAIVTAPCDAAYASLEIRDVSPRYETTPGSNSTVSVNGIVLTRDGAHIEPHPNATRASLAFSFDWESAMGGLIHSKGGYDRATAERRGLEMREGANWLKSLFERHNVKATFYATGYNLIDGNKGRRRFAGDPTYEWAQPKYGWNSDYWLTHRWYSDDPYGDFRTNPEWYFGDQTRVLYNAGHEIAPHTFGHLYVRGSNPQELGADMDEWLSMAKERGLPQPTTFAFPWRSSNSLTADFYDVLYKKGIRAVTRLYEREIRDFYTLAAVPRYPQMALMPDFLLGAPAGDEIEEADGGQVIGREEGLLVIQEVIARRGTTSFWTHPEQLAPNTRLAPVRDAWDAVVGEAAKQRDAGNLWVGTVAEIAAYQADIAQVSVKWERGFLNLGGWKLVVHNDSGKELDGVTLTMPGEVRRARSEGVAVRFVRVTSGPGDVVPGRVEVVESQVQPTRQLVLNNLKPGAAEVEIEWMAGQEPLE